MRPDTAAGLLAISMAAALPGHAQEEKTERMQAPANVLRPARVEATPERMAQLKVPAGFVVAPFATGLKNARILAVAPDGSLLVADNGAGVVELRKGEGHLIVELPGVTDVAPIGRSNMFALTGAGEADTAAKLFRVSRGGLRELADLAAFEANVNPDGRGIKSNPFDVAALSGGKALVADAAGNDLLIVDQQGHVDWVATFPDQLVSTANAKQLVGCPNPPPEFESVCGLPEMIPAQAVAASVAIGPDGAYYVGELKGFPGPTGASRV